MNAHENEEDAMIEIANIRTYRGKGVYVGRKNDWYGVEGSPLANPYPVSMGRDECIEAYDKWLVGKLKNRKSEQSIDVLGPCFAAIEIFLNKQLRIILNFFSSFFKTYSLQKRAKFGDLLLPFCSIDVFIIIR